MDSEVIAVKPVKSRTMQDIRPNAMIHCMVCGTDKPQGGSMKFRAHHVCRECAQKLQAKAEGETK